MDRDTWSVPVKVPDGRADTKTMRSGAQTQFIMRASARSIRRAGAPSIMGGGHLRLAAALLVVITIAAALVPAASAAPGSVDPSSAEVSAANAALTSGRLRVATGDLNGDGRRDRVVGRPNRSVDGVGRAGVVLVYLGTRSGLPKRPTMVITQGGPKGDRPERGDRFGSSVALGDLDGDGDDDLAVGSRGEDLRRVRDAGMVQIFPGSARGLRRVVWSTAGLRRSSMTRGMALGVAVATADLDGNGRAELIVGARSGARQRSGTDARVIARTAGRNLGLLQTSLVAARRPAAAPAPGSPTQAGPDRSGPEWLRATNLFRFQAGLDPVRDDAAVSRRARAFSKGLVTEGAVSHGPAGSIGQSSVVMGTSWGSAPDAMAVEGWATGPFHAVYLLDPRLETVGFGSARKADDAPCGPLGCTRMAATMEIFSGRTGDAARRPVVWPSDGAVVSYDRHMLGERPDPQAHCPGATGTPVVAMFPSSDDGKAAKVRSVRLTDGDGNTVGHCSFDSTNYRNSEISHRELGRNILRAGNAVVVMPTDTLVDGGRYCYTITTDQGRVTGCFEVDTGLVP